MKLGVFQCGEDITLPLDGMVPRELTRALANAPRGRIHDAKNVHVIIGALDRREIRDDVLHIRAVKEAACTDNAIRDLLLAKLTFQDAALLLCAKKHGHVIPLLTMSVHLDHFIRDDGGLFFFVFSSDEPHRLMAGVLAPKTLSTTTNVVSNEAVRRV